MKKIISVVLAALMLASAPALYASAAENSNHYVEEGYPVLDDDERFWQIYCWSCVDTEITAIGYRLDDAETVWTVTTVDTRDDNDVSGDNDAFRDYTLETALLEYSLTNGLEDFFGYRIMLTIDLSNVEKGKHNVEITAKYADGTEGNPLRESIYTFKKKTEASGAAATEAATGAETEAKTEPVTEAQTEAKTEPVTEAKTEAKTEEAKPAETKANETKRAEEQGKKSNTLLIVVIIIAAIAVAAVAGLLIFKKKKK